MAADSAPHVGRRRLRVEDPRLLTGGGRFVDDVELPGMLHAAFVRSPHPHARILGIDTEAALALDGVHAVVTGADLAEVVQPFVSALERPEVRTLVRDVLTTDRVRHVGEAVAVVVASSRYLAEDGCDLVAVDWAPTPAVADPLAAMTPDAPQVDPDAPGNLVADIRLESGDVEGCFAGADHVFAKRLHAQRHWGAPLENDGVLASYVPATDELTMWCTTQTPHATQSLVADALGMPSAQVRVIAHDMGGGFGARARTSVEEAIVPAVSRLLGRPVKWIADRSETLAAGVHAKEMVVDLSVAVTNGRLTAMRADVISDAGAYSLFPFTSLVDAISAPAAMPGIYVPEALAYRTRSVLTNKSWSGPYRGIGQGVSQVVRELLVDEVARELEVDPIELRVRNMATGDGPHRTHTGFVYDGGSYVQALRAVQERMDYAGLRDEQRRRRAAGEEPYLGIGVGAYVEFSGWSGELGRAHGYPSDYYDSASVTVEPDGSVMVTTGAQSHGQSHETTLAQVAADALGVAPDEVTVREGDTATSVWGMGTWASRTAVIYGGAIMRAAGDVRGRMALLAGHMLECSPDDVEMRDGRVWVAGSPDAAIAFADVAGFAYFGTAMAGHAGTGGGRPGELDVALTSTRPYSPPQVFSNGAIGVVATVDPGTGVVAVERVAFVEDCGTMLNPMVVDGQIAGSVGQAIGAALFEELSYGDDGAFLSPTLQDYLLPTALDMPALDIGHLVSPSPVTEGGIKGMGEVGMVCGPAAIACAVADALAPLGVRIDRMPLDPDGVLDAIRRARD
ncbi:xanthine dehydrogenase family protein molybdopterin-binding subunit [Capillimicrobium parvum]|uniref:Caffeine dehydrogenase subunit alpha n=1 Tax=Capillimicrobium parvum TaxID=2884022 RepID=A0A9E7C220_9ACTN|nr:xanthine dehydrogenase family protein molybdopterin-binding subunit [Capillimicrobium parvum]UGS37274.1 Caffeine dehydrogenase subunit alpha [Capillimicrobium parvum]